MLDSELLRSFNIRSARKEECEQIARFYQMSSDGVADYIWNKLATPGESLIAVGARRYQRENTAFSYQNCLFATIDDKPIGMLFAFPMKIDPDYVETDPVLAPYGKLEEDASYYISGIAIAEEFRGQNIGSLLISKAHSESTKLGLKRISLLVFEQNTRAKRLYDRLGFEVIDSAEVVPHKLIHYTGRILLMSRNTIKPEMELVQMNEAYKP